MTIFARDPDTGMAKWVYQMTPHDEWDFDGINEMILVDGHGGRTARTHDVLVHFDRNGLGYTLDRDTGELLVAEKYDPAVNWTTGVDMDPRAARTTAARRSWPKYSTEQNGEDVQLHRDLPGGPWHQGPAAGRVLAQDQAVLRADQPRLHGL